MDEIKTKDNEEIETIEIEEKNNQIQVRGNNEVAIENLQVTLELIHEDLHNKKQDYVYRKYVYTAVLITCFCTIIIMAKVIIFFDFTLINNYFDDKNTTIKVESKAPVVNVEPTKLPTIHVAAQKPIVSIEAKNDNNLIYYKDYGTFHYYNDSQNKIYCHSDKYRREKNSFDYIFKPHEYRKMSREIINCKNTNIIKIEDKIEFNNLRTATIGKGGAIVSVSQ
jgi:preprotein translocase subunit SecD